jgi:hypothetical protein
MAKAKFKPATVSESRLYRLSLKIGIVCAIVAIPVSIVAIIVNSGSTNIHHPDNITVIHRKDGEKEPGGTGNRPDTISRSNFTMLRHTTKQKYFLGIRTTGEQWNNSLSEKLAELFSSMGYDPKETVLNSTYSFDNVICGNLTLSGPQEINGAFNTRITEYSLALTLQFYEGASKIPCLQRMYSVTVDNQPDKIDIIRQGVTELVDQLKNETTFPFCIPKKIKT